MPLLLRYLVNFLITSAVFYAADWSLFQRMEWWQNLMIAASIVTVAAAVSSARMPAFVMLVSPFPLSITLMILFFNWDWQAWVYTYVLTLVYYTLLHILLSTLVQYHSLLPMWRVREAFGKQDSSSF